MSKLNVLRIYDNVAVFENVKTGNCLLWTQIKEGGYRSRDLQVCDRSQLSDMNGSSQVIPFEAIFGLYDLLSGPYAAIVVDSESNVSVGAINIRKAKKILVIPMFRSGRPLSETRQRDENRYLQLLHLGFQEHSFYFSLTFDITLTQQQTSLLSSRQFSEPVWMRADTRFFWNRAVVTDLIACEAYQWIVPFMSAYVEVQPNCEIEADKFTLIFISRRSRNRQGCRFVKRGIDDLGHCANFVETEQILVHADGKVTSFVQVRGSIPLKWSSPVLMKYEPNVYIDSDTRASHDAAERHFNELVDNYCDKNGSAEVVCINLIDDKKDQGRLGVAYKEVIEQVQTRLPHPLHFVWFDYHQECRQKGKEKNLVKLLEQVNKYFKSQKYFCRLASGVVSSYQSGVFRTNCMDNLDRTNVVQSILARRSIFQQLGKAASFQDNLANSIDSPYKKFETLFKTVWVNNADAISYAYAGTNALKTDVVKKGKRSYKGMFKDGWNSVMRYYINNFTDGVKQDSIDLLLGNFSPDPLMPSPFIPRPEQESLADNVTKAFVLMMVVFSTLLLLTSPLSNPHLSNFLMPPSARELDLLTSHASPTCTIANANVSTDGAPTSSASGTNDGPEACLRVSTHISHRNLSLLSNNLLLSFFATAAMMVYLIYRVVKKGSKIGECIVVHPQLCCSEPIITLPS